MRAVFVCGPGRSGTTVMRQALSHHPDVATMPGEFRLITDPDGVLDLEDAFTTKWDPYGTDAAIRRFRQLLSHMTSDEIRLYRGYHMDEWIGRTPYQHLAKNIDEALHTRRSSASWTGSPWSTMDETARGSRARELCAFVEDLYRRRNPDATHWVDDTPHAGLHAERIRRVFPDHCFLICVRHPLDVYASFLHGGHSWTPKDPKTAALRIESVMLNTRMAVGWRRHSFAIVKLEDAVESPVRVLTRVCDALGLETTDDVLTSMAGVYDGNAAGIGRWKRDLTPEELDVGRELLAASCRVYGYEA